MGLREDIQEAKEEIQDLKEQSLAMELYQDSVKDKKRFFYMWLITFILFIGLLIYTIYLSNDIGVIESSQEIQDVNTIENSDIINGELYGEDKTN